MGDRCWVWVESWIHKVHQSPHSNSFGTEDFSIRTTREQAFCEVHPTADVRQGLLQLSLLQMELVPAATLSPPVTAAVNSNVPPPRWHSSEQRPGSHSPMCQPVPAAPLGMCPRVSETPPDGQDEALSSWRPDPWCDCHDGWWLHGQSCSGGHGERWPHTPGTRWGHTAHRRAVTPVQDAASTGRV